ncbi:MAG: DUF2892 domain-containing protein [Acidobacteria bacterium]|nr:DUF2892 domain-containing protein [Acidobacteriota bacterium]MCA1649173.1 DUF2892 domain-containing protein [Acidobacteriota bacterium]
MIIVYGADWCEDTRRSLRHLRRLGVASYYVNIDEDLDALDRAKSLNAGRRRTPTIDLGVGGAALVEPDNDTLTAALVEMQMLTVEDVDDRMDVQNIGDVERIGRTLAGLALLGLAAGARRGRRWPIALVGAVVGLTGVAGCCPACHFAGVTSIGGPGDHPDEASRTQWFVKRPTREIPGEAS